MRSEARVVETPDYIICDREEGGNRGVDGTQAMLGGGEKELI